MLNNSVRSLYLDEHKLTVNFRKIQSPDPILKAILSANNGSDTAVTIANHALAFLEATTVFGIQTADKRALASIWDFQNQYLETNPKAVNDIRAICWLLLLDWSRTKFYTASGDEIPVTLITPTEPIMGARQYDN